MVETGRKPKLDLSGQLRKAIAESGLSMLKVAELSGLRYQTVHGFARCTRDVYLTSAAKMAAVVGLELRPVPKPRAKRSEA